MKLALNRFEFVEMRGREGHAGLFPIKSQPLADRGLVGQWHRVHADRPGRDPCR